MTLAFDVYGTLFDVNSLVEELKDPDLVGRWRRKQLEYTWLLTAMGRFESFWEVTRKALIHAAKELGVRVDTDRAMRAWLNLKPFEDAVKALPKINDRKLVLTNGDEWMVRELLRNSGLSDYVDGIVSAERVRKYKPAVEVYRLAGEATFVSSNPWDVAGAHNAGLPVIYVNRHNQELEEIDPGGKIRVVRSLEELL